MHDLNNNNHARERMYRRTYVCRQKICYIFIEYSSSKFSYVMCETSPTICFIHSAYVYVVCVLLTYTVKYAHSVHVYVIAIDITTTLDSQYNCLISFFAPFFK